MPRSRPSAPAASAALLHVAGPPCGLAHGSGPHSRGFTLPPGPAESLFTAPASHRVPRAQPSRSGSRLSPQFPPAIPDKPKVAQSSSSSRPPCLVAWPCPLICPVFHTAIYL
ncbi:hypothetical protein NDU88_002700 [Pleurodeles waltl]|uniref:Secreted protein n=1 Tax=Pleurodeles waltl TaxID=8319 RepID=A0AAV7RAR4_PLEWA|nr:hypothetical protein NDU88_002700 [Pleurodeles waltl]